MGNNGLYISEWVMEYFVILFGIYDTHCGAGGGVTLGKYLCISCETLKVSLVLCIIPKD